MQTTEFGGKTYQTDLLGFLVDHRDWDRTFAEGLAEQMKIPGGLTNDHWKIISYIRRSFEIHGYRPLVFQACKDNGLRLHEMKRLFPQGYLRCACRIAGMTYTEGFLDASDQRSGLLSLDVPGSVFAVDRDGYLNNPVEWTEAFAQRIATEQQMHSPLTDRHWGVIKYLRHFFEKHGIVPSVYETCDANDLRLEELAHLFPGGYHRGAVKMAGLKFK